MENNKIILPKNKLILSKNNKIILSVIVAIIFAIIIICILVSIYTKDNAVINTGVSANPSPKALAVKCPNPSSNVADNGQCCPYGVTQYSKQCYLTNCTGIKNKNGIAGVRNKNGICCTNGITNKTTGNGNLLNLNCKSEKDCPPSKQLNNICCTYGLTQFKINCYLSDCNSKSRTLYGKCCKNGLAKNDSTCNKTCNTDKNTFSGGCCEYGVAENTKYCKTKECAYYTKKGKCCPNNVTINGSNCNITCNHVANIFTTFSGKQICCPYGTVGNIPKHSAKNASTICNSNNCNGIGAQRTSRGECCTHGVTIYQNNCMLKCGIHSTNTVSGKCCPNSYGLTDRGKCYSTPCNLKNHIRSVSGECCTGTNVAIYGACLEPCPKGGSNTMYYGKCCPHGIAPGQFNSYKICNQTCTTQRGGSGVSNIKNRAQDNSALQNLKSSHASTANLKKNAALAAARGKYPGAPNPQSNSVTLTHVQHDIMGKCCISGLTTKSWKYCNSVCKSITVTMSDYSTLKQDKSQLENKIHAMGGFLDVISEIKKDYKEVTAFFGNNFPIYNDYIKPYIQEFKNDFIKPIEQQIQHYEEDILNMLPYGASLSDMLAKVEHVLHPSNLPFNNDNSSGNSSGKGGKLKSAANNGKLTGANVGNGSGIQKTHVHPDLNKQHLSTGKCCTYGKTFNQMECFTTNCTKPKERLINNSKVCCNATENKTNCKTETIKNLITDIQNDGLLYGALAYKCGNAGLCGIFKSQCAPNCSKQVSAFCKCCTGNNTCLTSILGACGTKWAGVCWPK